MTVSDVLCFWQSWQFWGVLATNLTEHPSVGICLIVFLMARLGSWVSEEDHISKAPHPHSIMSRAHTVNIMIAIVLTLVTWPKWSTWSRVCQRLPCKVTPPFPRCHLWKAATGAAHASGAGSYASPSWKWSSYMNHLEFFSMGDLPLLSQLYMYSINCLYQSGLMLFIISVYF